MPWTLSRETTHEISEAASDFFEDGTGYGGSRPALFDEGDEGERCFGAEGNFGAFIVAWGVSEIKMGR